VAQEQRKGARRWSWTILEVNLYAFLSNKKSEMAQHFTLFILGVLNLAVDFRSSGGSGSLLGALAPVGSPLSRTPAGR
jgi:hypothetical protein